MRSAGARPAPAAQITRTDVTQLRRASRRASSVGPPARDRLQLVERAAGVTEASSRELRHRGAARGDERAQHERHLVAHAARRMLVDGRASQRREVEPLAAVDHRLRPHAPARRVACPWKKIAMQQRRRLLVGDLARRCMRRWNQWICSSLRRPPSRLARMSSTASISPAQARVGVRTRPAADPRIRRGDAVAVDAAGRARRPPTAAAGSARTA